MPTRDEQSLFVVAYFKSHGAPFVWLHRSDGGVLTLWLGTLVFRLI